VRTRGGGEKGYRIWGETKRRKREVIALRDKALRSKKVRSAPRKSPRHRGGDYASFIEKEERRCGGEENAFPLCWYRGTIFTLVGLGRRRSEGTRSSRKEGFLLTKRSACKGGSLREKTGADLGGGRIEQKEGRGDRV